MSKQGKRKITVELPKTKDLASRPSVFERLGTKKAGAKKTSEHCRQWAQNGTCAYGKSCKFAATHTLISPSKQRAANKDDVKRLKDDSKSRLHSTVVVRSGGRSPDADDNWDQSDLDALVKRRLQLQRELDLQLKMESGKNPRKDKKKQVSSSSSSRSSSSSSVSSSSSGGSSSSSSSARDTRKKIKKGKLKRANSSSSSEGDVPSKKKYAKASSLKRDKSASNKKGTIKKDDRLNKKHEATKKKVLTKTTINKKSLSPGKKSGGTPPITAKAKNYAASKKSPPRRKDRSLSPPAKEREKERERKEREREKDKEREKERDKERERRGRSKSRGKGRSRSPIRRHESHPKDARRKESSDRSRPISPKKGRRESPERHRKSSPSRDRRDHKDRSLERRKDEKDRHERERKEVAGRPRERPKDVKREADKRNRGGRDRGLDKGLEKPSKPMERLLPRPEERLAALAAISNRNLETDKASTTSKDRQESERGGRKAGLDRSREDPRVKRGERMSSIDRDHSDYERGLERPYDHGHPMDYERGERYDDVPREEDDRSPGWQGRDRHYDPGYDPRGYPEPDDRGYVEHHGDHRDLGFDERRGRREHSWDGRGGSIERGDRGYPPPHPPHPHKEWEGEEFRPVGDWPRERHWQHHEPQMGEWGDEKPDMEGWHHRGPPPHAQRGRMHDGYGRGGGMRMGRGNQHRRPEPEPRPEPPAAPGPAPAPQPDVHEPDLPIPDDLSEISDDPDDILNRDDMLDQNAEEDSQVEPAAEDQNSSKVDALESHSTQESGTASLVECKQETSEARDDEDAQLDFEEISDGELEEERHRAGLGDALGVDWASLVADVKRREQAAATTGARLRWRPERALARVGLSVRMAGPLLVKEILQRNADSLKEEKVEVKEEDVEVKKELVEVKKEPEELEQGNGFSEDKDKEKTTDAVPAHPVASIQVAIAKRGRQRAALFGSGCEITRALSARRDLALRRHLCQLPAGAGAAGPGARPVPHAPPAALHRAARALLVQARG